MSTYIFKKPIFDEFTLRLFYNLDKEVPVAHDSIYMWSILIDPNWSGNTWSEVFEKFLPAGEDFYRSELIKCFKEDTILLGIKDHLTSGHYDPYTSDTPNSVQYLLDMFDVYKDKKFILFTSLENLELYINRPNVQIIPWGGDITNQKIQYSKIEPVLDKNLDSPTTFLSLNRNKRSNRFYVLSLLHGLGIQDKGLISCMFQDELAGAYELYNWKFSEPQKPIKSVFDCGAEQLLTAEFSINDNVDIYTNGDNNNATNFESRLRNYYMNTFVELICETSYTEKSFLITEKTQNCIFGCNFPIWVSSKGTVKFFREMGLDVFDDIINHRYDKYDDPIDRLYAAVNDNYELLSNNKLTKSIWVANQERFIKNVEFIKTGMYNFYEERAKKLFRLAWDK